MKIERLSERVPKRLGFYNDGPCQWCKKAPATMIVNLPGNALFTRVCASCFEGNDDGRDTPMDAGDWREICYDCMGMGQIDDITPCPDCDGEGYAYD